MESNAINRPRSWNGNPLPGEWLVTVKIDGVRAIWQDGLGWLSRAGKPLHYIPPWQRGSARDCEIFVGTFRDTIRATRTKLTKRDTPTVQPQHMYGLEPLDERMRWGTLKNPSAADIHAELQRANHLGHEGIVLRQADRWIKVKPEETHDVTITGFTEGKGKHSGRLGFVSTTRGAVGAGFSDSERELLWAEAQASTLIGQVIEVSCLELTADRKFRHPFFVRMRPDKSVT